MGERAAPAPPAEAEAEQPRAPVTLSELVERARNSADDERRWLSGLVLEALEKVPVTPMPERDRQVALVLEFLDDEVLHGLVAPNGVECRTAAVEVVLRVGYPWALQLEPEDMAFFRTQRPAFERLVWPAKLSAAVAGGASLVTLAASVAHGPSLPTWLWDRLSDPIDLAVLVGLVSAILGAAPMLGAEQSSRPHLLGRLLMGLGALALAGALVADAFSTGLTYLHGVFFVPAIAAAVAALWPKR